VARPVVIKITGDASGFEKAVSKVEGLGKKMGGALATTGKVAGAALLGAGVAVGAFALKAVGNASDLQEAMSKVSVVFGDQAGEIAKWADGSAKSMGISTRAALEGAGTLGNLFSAMKVAPAATAEMSKSIMGLASDLASFNNADPAEVMDALRAGLVGETEPLRKFGVNLNQARIEAKALEMGLWDGKDAISAGAKAQAAYALIMEDTTLAQGDFARTSGGLANQQRILKAQVENLSAKIGTALLPIVTKVVNWITSEAIPAAERWWQRWQPAFDRIISKVGDLGRYFGIVKDAITAAVTWLSNIFGSKSEEMSGSASRLSTTISRLSAFFSSTFGAIRAVVETVVKIVMDLWARFGEQLVGRLVSALSALWDGMNGFMQALSGIMDLIKAILTGKWGEAWDAIKKILSGALQMVLGLLRAAWNVVTGLFEVLKGTVSALWSLLWNSLRTVLSDAWASMKNLAKAGVDSLVGFIAGIPSRIGGLASSILSSAAGIGRAIVNGIGNGLSGAVGFVSDLGAAIRRTITGAINTVVDALNNAIPNQIGLGPFSVDLPDNPIPRIRAMGGPAEGLVSVGERGPEQVLLPRGSRVIPHHATTSAGVSVYVQGSTPSPYEVGTAVAWAMRTAGR
jgi:hypothetical protein